MTRAGKRQCWSPSCSIALAATLLCQVSVCQALTWELNVQVDQLLKENTAIESHLTVYPGCGHVPMDDCRERFIQDLTDIVGAHCAPVEAPKPALSGNSD